MGRVYPMEMDAALETMMSPSGQFAAAACFTVGWAVVIESISRPIGSWVKSASWWPQALPNQVSLMVNFGYPKDGTTESMAVFAYVWICTMCLTHVLSAGLMIPVIVSGWSASSDLGKLCFLLGTVSEVGFDIYDGTKMTLTTFFHKSVSSFGYPQTPVKSYILVCLCHHAAVLSVTMPMNMKYVHMVQYQQIAFSLLASAGVCYLAGQYKLTLDARTPAGLAMIKKIMMVQFTMNWLTRIFIWCPAVYSTLTTFHASGDTAYFYGACMSASTMSIYNLLVVMDATAALFKWLPRTIAMEDKKK